MIGHLDKGLIPASQPDNRKRSYRKCCGVNNPKAWRSSRLPDATPMHPDGSWGLLAIPRLGDWKLELSLYNLYKLR